MGQRSVVVIGVNQWRVGGISGAIMPWRNCKRPWVRHSGTYLFGTGRPPSTTGASDTFTVFYISLTMN